MGTKSAMRWIGRGSVTVLFLGAVVVAMAWLFGAFHERIDERPGPGVEARPVGDRVVQPVTSETLPRIEKATGTVQAVREAVLASKLLATVSAVHVQAGRSVHEGDLLVALDDRDLVARLDQAEARVTAAKARREQAGIDLDRVRQLHEQGVAPQSELDAAETGVRTTQAEGEAAQQAAQEARTVLAWAKVLAPMDGVVVDKHVEAGDTVTPGTPLVTLYDPSRMQLVASVRESLRDRLEVGDRVTVEIAALGRVCEGTVGEIVPASSVSSRSFLVKVTGPCPPGILTGMFGRLWIPLDEESVVTIPEGAVRRIGQMELVDVVVDGVLRRRAVQTGRLLGDRVEVLSGLALGESVVLADDGTGAGR